MIAQIALGSLAIIVTILFHAWLFRMLSRLIDHLYAPALEHHGHGGMSALLMLGVLGVLFGISADIWFWALLLQALGALPDLEQAVYFSLVSFSTLGYGDIVLALEWRILGAMVAANGLLIFGWSIAWLTEVIRKLRGGP